MAKRTTTSSETTANQVPAPPTTQRAYTLRLRRAPGKCQQCGKDDCACWREALWATHEAVNKGAKVFGDWLLTLRGGLSHEMAEPPHPPKGKHRSDAETAALRKNRRIMLALSWLSVEDERGAPPPDSGLIIAYGDKCKHAQDNQTSRDRKVVDALRGILANRKLPTHEPDAWIADCKDSLKVRIREDAVWVNRSAAFDAARQEIGDSLTREEVWDILEPFFGSRESYLAPVELAEDESGEQEKAKDRVQKAGQWLSSRFGTGTGADFESMAKVYAAMTTWANTANSFSSGADAVADLARSLTPFNPPSADAQGILTLISGPGYKSATRNKVKAWSGHATAVTMDDLAGFSEVTAEDEKKCKDNVGGKGRRPWSDKILEKVESACGFTYLQQDGPAQHSEFAVMLDHAARRVSIGHSWIKRAEAQRRKFEEDAKRLEHVPDDAAEWLDAFVAERSGTSGATAAGGEYRIRRRAIEGWEEVIKKWKRAPCKTEEDRITAAREVQADPEIDKFGDIQLFEALAADDAECLWRQNGSATPETLRDYVLGHDARYKQRRFKVPAYRHPDPLRHPVFGDFGKSRWDIEYAVHEAAKAADKKRAPDPGRAEWLKDQHGLRMGLRDGNTVCDIPLRWSSKRLTKDLALNARNGKQPTQDVGRADRLGRAASGVREGQIPSATELFKLADWNGRLQAPRRQLDDLAKHLDKNGGTWDAKAEKMRDRLAWLVTFSAKLECRGPWYAYFNSQPDKSPFRKKVTSGARRGQTYESMNGWPHAILNENREGHTKLILSRLPGLRVLSVDLGHRFAAACAVWETISADAMKREVGERSLRAGGTGEDDLFCHVETPTDKVVKNGRNKGKLVTEITIYRRIGEDFLRDPKSGRPTDTLHPAPWARLDRQFFIKLQGEERPARAATNGKLKDGSPTEIDEMAMVAKMARDLGLLRDDAEGTSNRGVDELMRRAVRVATLGLKRHGRMAKIAYAFRPDCPGIPGMGGSLKAIARGDDDHIKFLTNELADWHALAIDTDWDGSEARRLWNLHIKPLSEGFEISEPTPPDPDAERPTPQQRRKSEEGLREKLKPIAEHLAKAEAESTRGIHEDWAKAWSADDGKERTNDDFEHTLIRDGTGKVIGSRTSPKPGKESPGGWHERLRALTDWIMGWHLPGAESKCWNRNVGGLSLTRIATMRALYQLHKAFAMRPRPHEVQGAPERGESNVGVAQSILDAMERMREQRVKQIASRIVEAALGIGIEHDRVWDEVKKKWRCLKRPRGLLYYVDEQGVTHGVPRFKTCHTVVIENLRNYRPDELQTRRENKALMSWSAGKVRKYLEEACQLHGLHLREVMPNYTSRQCSRTGLPGIRCVDVPVAEFIKPHWRARRAVKNLAQDRKGATWEERVAQAAKAAKAKRENSDAPGDSEDCLIVELLTRWDAASKTWTDAFGIRWKLEENNGQTKWTVILDQSLCSNRKYDAPSAVRLPSKGGDLFVAAPSDACATGTNARAIQADLNAAANIGLRALLDPDFPGKWWYVPATMEAGWRVPAPKSCAGAACLSGWKVAPKDGFLSADGQPLAAAGDETVKQAKEAEDLAKKELNAAKKAAKKAGADQTALDAAKDRYNEAKEASKEAKKAASQKEIVNVWQDPCAQRTSPSAGRWWETTAYWNRVRSQVVSRFRAAPMD